MKRFLDQDSYGRYCCFTCSLARLWRVRTSGEPPALRLALRACFLTTMDNGFFTMGTMTVCFVFLLRGNGGEPLAHRESRRLSTNPHPPEASEWDK